MPTEHQFTRMIAATPHQLEADEFLAVHGRPHPRHRHLRLGYDFEIRDVTAGTTVEAGHCDDEDDAEDQAALAFERAQDADGGRIARELGIVFGASEE